MSNPDKVWSLADDIGICMYITHDGDRHRARPMSAAVRRDEDAIYFLTDVASAKTHQTEHDATVTLAFIDKSKHDYVSITGRAEVLNDREKIRELFNPFAKAWWESADDPEIRVIRVTPEDAEYWDGPGGPVATVKMLAAAATGGRPDMGDNEKVSM
ncbi:general stress protein [Devosia pacifica]|uniref:General stress protein n=1 Tax=Devosia pacifica TaxID=1335967 RepID=A0A918S1U2_9HYPH|nr:pyridoxamine 5'-phosphate oxidase family protein [Devosia pacifica]GHA17007.1 general stress protein [Devosia pacifica]